MTTDTIPSVGHDHHNNANNTGDLLCAVGAVLSTAAALSEALVTAADAITEPVTTRSLVPSYARHRDALQQCLCLAADLDDSLATLLAELGINLPTGIPTDATHEALHRLLGHQ